MAVVMKSGYRYCGQNYYNVNDADWNLLGAIDSRNWSKEIAFVGSFVTTPTVHVMISGLYVLEGDPVRVSVAPSAVTTSGFTLNIHTYGGTQVAGVCVQWMAYTS